MDALLDASTKVAGTIEDIRGGVNDEDFKRYALAVGQIPGSVQLDLMPQITREYPRTRSLRLDIFDDALTWIVSVDHEGTAWIGWR